MPDYQKGAAGYYLTHYYPGHPSTIWNSTGIMRLFSCFRSGSIARSMVNPNSSTKDHASPVSGAILTMINDARIAAGKGPIDFINPTIYSSGFAGAFNDITEGTNPGCGTPVYNATDGWAP